MSKLIAVVLGVMSLALAAPSFAADESPSPSPEQQAALKKLQALSDSLHPQFGDVRIANAGVTLHLGKAYYYLSSVEAKRVLTDGWGNPADMAEGVEGMVFPAGEDFVSSDWGAVITFEQSGFVTDKDADKADYGKMMQDMKAGEADRNKSRAEAGFPKQHLVGWAQTPTYDKASHTMVWAREITFEGDDKNTLNYDARVLGRHGVLSLNMVSTMPLLEDVRKASATFVRTAQYDAGAQYADFNPKFDKKAEYGVAGLVAAGVGLAVAKKAGLLAVILLFAKKGAVFLLAGAGAAWAWIKRRLGGKAQA